jgi:hypothetical protein
LVSLKVPGIGSRKGAKNAEKTHRPANPPNVSIYPWQETGTGMKFAHGMALLLTLLFHVGNAFCAKQACISVDGLNVCVLMKGPCDLYHLVPNEKTNMKMDLLHISIMNTSTRTIRIRPENFHGVTVDKQAISVDAPFYDSIELKKKLIRKDLGPQEKLEGFLFFPSFFGSIRSLVHTGNPYFEIRLY